MIGKLLYKIFDFLGINRRYNFLKHKTFKITSETIDVFFKIGLSVVFFLVLIWLSILFYVLFYYTYVPTIEHVKPVNLQFTPCSGMYDESCSGRHEYPKAHIQLSRFNSFLMVGQPYKITVVMELPESENNKDLGTFMVCGKLAGKEVVVAHSCRATMLRYRSPLLNMIRLLTLGPLFVFDILQEKQTLTVELFSNFEEDQKFPITDMYLELESEQIEVYSSKVQIEAHLSGLRYIMFHWPFFSAVLGSVFNLGIIIFIMLLSWYKLYGPTDITGKEYFIKQIRELTPMRKLAFASKVVKLGDSLEDSSAHFEVKSEYDATNNDPIDNVEEIGGKKCLILKDSEVEEETARERKFVLERKLSSSDA